MLIFCSMKAHNLWIGLCLLVRLSSTFLFPASWHYFFVRGCRSTWYGIKSGPRFCYVVLEFLLLLMDCLTAFMHYLIANQQKFNQTFHPTWCLTLYNAMMHLYLRVQWINLNTKRALRCCSGNALSLFFVRLPTYRASAASMAAVFGFKCGRPRPPISSSSRGMDPILYYCGNSPIPTVPMLLGIQWLLTF